jgi:hypothetical protein
MGGLKTQISDLGREEKQDGDNELKIEESVINSEDFLIYILCRERSGRSGLVVEDQELEKLFIVLPGSFLENHS